MPSFIRFMCLVVLSSTLLRVVQAQTAQKPVTDSELMALVAGNALSENIIYQMTTRGLAFHPDAIYKTQLKSAGADAIVLGSLDKAKVETRSQAEEGPTELELITHLSNAGRMLGSKQFDAATNELTAALKEGADAEAGFVMGEVLRREEQFDLAVSVYKKVLQQNPDFPEAHTKFAFVLYRAKQFEDAMRESKLALAKTPNNAEGHKNLGLALMALREFDASIGEYRESLRIKPDYAASYFDLGLAYESKHDVVAAIQEYRKAVALDATEGFYHYRLATLLKDSGDTEGAIHEFREAKRVAPDRIDVRHDMALALADVDPDAAIKEFHELIAMAPDFELAHVGLGMTYSRQGKYGAAKSEYRIAMAMDPTDSIAHSNLGSDLEKQKKYDEAMQEFLRATELDDNSARAHAGIGRIYLVQKKYADAARELRRAELLNTNFFDVHSTLAEALVGSGDISGAIVELKQAEALAPQNYRLMSMLAPLLEKTGDAKGALEQYRLAAEESDTDQARKDYAAAQARLKGEASVARTQRQSTPPQTLQANAATTADPESTWRSSMDASTRAINGSLFADAEKNALTAVSLAEKLPHDDRLVQSTFQLAWVYTREKKYSEARSAWMRALSVSQELSGPESQETAHALEGLAGCSFELKDFAGAADFFGRAVQIQEKTLGPSNHALIRDLYWLAFSYQSQGAYAKAEPIFLKLLEMNSAKGHDGLFSQGDLLLLGKLYLAWGKLDKAETYCRKSLAEREHDYGADSPMLAESLQTLSDVLKQAGRGDEAAQIKQRYDSISASSGQENTKP